MAPRKTTEAKTPPPPPAVEQVPASPPVRVEIRIGGRLRFVDDVYGPLIDVEGDTVDFSASRKPIMIDKPGTTIAPTRFIDQTDPRDQAEIIQRVHSGRRDIAEEPHDDDTGTGDDAE